MNILICIPAFNAADSLTELIHRTRTTLAEYPHEHRILVIDDGSTDTTTMIAKELAVSIFSHPKNLGKGQALRTGFQMAIQEGFDWVVTIDSDLQHDPVLIPHLLDHAITNGYDIVIGSRRFDPGGMSLARIFSNSTTTWLISKRIGQRIPDSQSGYRVIRTEILKRVTLSSSRYETESELLIKAGKSGARIGSLPMETIYGKETSHIRHVQDTLRFILMYFRTWFE